MRTIHDRNKLWEMRSGEKIPIKDMTDSHLRNTINAIKEGRIFRDIVRTNIFTGDPEEIYQVGRRRYWIDLLEQEVVYRENYQGLTDQEVAKLILKEKGWLSEL